MSSSNQAISIRGLGKRYLLPHRRGRWWQAHLREFFPALAARDGSDYFWALRDLDLDVERGEVLGIIGHNGSGKSTLLKILSRIIEPTAGRAVLRGRVGSLLEVGTGFHPDLTGRENVYMAGALIGLSQRSIRARFDAIVDFAGIEDFIDVPVKRYSSGMYVRLAYAVASNLDCDILILDEVLAVGDAAFREKSEENIERIAKDGRTILLVSHNARAVTSICQTAIVLEKGRCEFRGDARAAVTHYLRRLHGLDDELPESTDDTPFREIHHGHRLSSSLSVLRWVSLHREDGRACSRFRTGDSMIVRIGYENLAVARPYFAVLIMNDFGERVATFQSTHAGDFPPLPSSGAVECRVPELLLGDGVYWMMIDFGEYDGGISARSLDCVSNAIRCRVELDGYVGGVGITAYQGLVQRTCWRGLPPQTAPGVSAGEEP